MDLETRMANLETKMGELEMELRSSLEAQLEAQRKITEGILNELSEFKPHEEIREFRRVSI